MFRKYFLMIIALLWCYKSSSGQCSVISTDGYTVEISVTPQAIVAPTTCPFGYNYNVEMAYEIKFTGSAPATLYTMQGFLTCNQGDLFFNLPNNASSGTFVTTVNPFNNTSDCATATVTSLGCQEVNIDIEGPGIPAQTVNCSNNGLPIELLGFETNARNNGEVLLSWITLTETDNDYFTIERSANGLDWNEIQQIKGAGNSKEILYYRYIDPYPLPGISYYRLKQTDLDGSFSYSKIQSAQTRQSKQTLTIRYSNTNAHQITIEGSPESLSTLRVYNHLGQTFTTQVAIQSIHPSKITMDLTQLPSGVYFVRSPMTAVRVYRR